MERTVHYLCITVLLLSFSTASAQQQEAAFAPTVKLIPNQLDVQIRLGRTLPGSFTIVNCSTTDPLVWELLGFSESKHLHPELPSQRGSSARPSQDNPGILPGSFQTVHDEINKTSAPVPMRGGAPPTTEEASTELFLDDGSSETSLGLVTGGQFLWLNRFTLPPDSFPYILDTVQVLFNAGTGVTVGELIDIYLYEDTDGDGDPGTNAVLVDSLLNVAVQATDSITWSVYPLTSPVLFSGPGDILIGVVNRTAGADPDEYPAAIDLTTSQERSWIGTYLAGNPPAPPPLPADDLWGLIDDFGIPGNWMIRGTGLAPCDDESCDWIDASPTGGVLGPGATQVVDLSFNFPSSPLALGPRHCTLVVSSSSPVNFAQLEIFFDFTATISTDYTGNNGIIIAPAAPTTYGLDLLVSNQTMDPQSVQVLIRMDTPTGDIRPIIDPPRQINNLPPLAVLSRTPVMLINPDGDWFDLGTYTLNSVLLEPVVGDTIHKYSSTFEVVASANQPPSLLPAELNTSENLPDATALLANYPNPFNPETTINYHLKKDSRVSLKIFDILGQEVAVLVNAYQHAGTYSVKWAGQAASGDFLGSGIYFYRMVADEYSKTRKMLLAR